MPSTITVRHNFETAHRLPFIGGKCVQLHGHSWWAEVTVEGLPTPDGVVLEFGPFKRALREWIDDRLDHGVMLGEADPLLRVLPGYDCKVYAFGSDYPSAGLMWPTVENAAELLARVASGLVGLAGTPSARVVRVHVQETHVNAATWTAP